MLYPFSRLLCPAQSPASCGPALRRKGGFNLIESAIVLGVVGLVIGGIWVAAATMYENYKVNKTVEDLLLIVRNIQSLISKADSIAMGDRSISVAIMDADGFPKDWIRGGQIRHPFGGVAYAGNEVPSASKGLFRVGLMTVPPSACVKLITKLTAISAMAGNANAGGWNAGMESRTDLARVRIADPLWATDNFPVSPEMAREKCGQMTSDITFYYDYTRIN